MFYHFDFCTCRTYLVFEYHINLFKFDKYIIGKCSVIKFFWEIQKFSGILDTCISMPYLDPNIEYYIEVFFLAKI